MIEGNSPIRYLGGLKAIAAKVCRTNQAFDLGDTNCPEEKLIIGSLSTSVKQTWEVAKNEPSGLFVVPLESSVSSPPQPDASWEYGDPEPQNI